tara:strand:+ start:458 stop:706 length:249 start_codon:yes stop_codon:yes gene_type:complete
MTELHEILFVTFIGLIIGGQLRCQDAILSINETVVMAWPIVSIIGFIFCSQTLIPLFYFANMVTIGWLAYDYIGIYPVHMVR